VGPHALEPGLIDITINIDHKDEMRHCGSLLSE
jgi:hypothetical protein